MGMVHRKILFQDLEVGYNRLWRHNNYSGSERVKVRFEILVVFKSILTLHLDCYKLTFKPLPDVDALLYEPKLVRRKRKQPASDSAEQTDQGQQSFKACPKYSVSMPSYP